MSASSSSIVASFRKHGLYVEDSWIDEAVAAVTTRTGDVLREAYLQYLNCDLRLAAPRGSGRLADVNTWKDGILKGLVAVQVEAIENIGDESARKDAQTWKTLLTDGFVDVGAFELSPIDDLAQASLGTKLLLKDVQVRRGLLLLEPCNTRVLGGSVLVSDNELVSEESTENQGTQIQPPPAKRSRPCYILLSEFENRAPPITVTAWAFVHQLKKFYWSSHHKRFLLIVAIRDSTATLDCVFAEEEFALLFGKSSRQVRALSEAQRAALSSQVSQKLRTYEGALQLQKNYQKNAFANISGRKHDALPLILSCTQISQNEHVQIRDMLATGASPSLASHSRQQPTQQHNYTRDSSLRTPRPPQPVPLSL